jgi:hypothetical protein
MLPDPRIAVPIPAYRGRSLANLSSSLWAALSSGREGTPPPLPPLAGDVDPFRGGRSTGPVVVLLLDGLGWTALLESADRGPRGVAARWAMHARPLTSVFPTTTTVALTSLSTGAAPGQHGVLGHRLYLPRFGTVVEILRMSPVGVAASETLIGPDWSPSAVSGVPSIFRRGVSGVALSRERFEGTGFTRLIYDGATFVAYSTGSDLALSLVEILSRDDPPPLVLAYRDDLDVVQHLRGARPELVDLELERADAILSFVARHLKPGLAAKTHVIVTGDHGQVPLTADQQLAVDREPTLLSHLSRPPSGDRRAAYFAARPGHLTALRETLEVRLPPGGRLLDMPAAVEAGLFGPPPFHPELSERIGDLLVLLPSPGGVSYSVPGARSRTHRMVATHGGLEPAELLVPLIAGSLTELALRGSPPRNTRSAARSHRGP